MTYDAFKRLTRTNHVGQVTLFEYDTHGNTVTVTDPENHTHRGTCTTTWATGFARTAPTPAPRRLDHNESGQVISQTDAAGQDSLLTYDAAGRLTGIDRAGPEYDVSYDFDDCANGAGPPVRHRRRAGVTVSSTGGTPSASSRRSRPTKGGLATRMARRTR